MDEEIVKLDRTGDPPGCATWDEWELRNDPPGMWVGLGVSPASDETQTWGYGIGASPLQRATGYASRELARVAAWACYWDCEDLTERLLNMDWHFYVWPGILLWPDEARIKLRKWLVGASDWMCLRRDEPPPWAELPDEALGRDHDS